MPVLISLDTHVARSPDNGNTRLKIAAPQFCAFSGKVAKCDWSYLRFEVTPTSNGDGTITVTAMLTEDANKPKQRVTIVPPVTAVDGRTTTHQIGDLYFTFTPKIEHH
jgi:hypothetical protein